MQGDLSITTKYHKTKMKKKDTRNYERDLRPIRTASVAESLNRLEQTVRNFSNEVKSGSIVPPRLADKEARQAE